ncbi:winged helix-turn-helix domain-containing protein [soil metagenome]
MGSQEPVYEFGEFRLDVAEKQLRRATGEVVAIPPKAFELLLLLVENPHHLLEKNELMDKVWTDSFVEEGNLKLHIHTLRKTLNENGVEYIETIPRRGYRFNADVAEVDGSLVVEKVTRSRLIFEQSESDGKFASASVPARPKAVLVAAILIAMAAGSTAFYFGVIRPRTPESITVAASESPVTIAVLPLKNLTGDKRDDFLSVGLADTLIGRLSQIRRLVVRPTSSVLPFVTGSDTPQKIGHSLRVDSVLNGTIQRVDGRIRVSVQLTGTADERVVWAGNFEAPEGDLFKFQDAFSDEIASALQFKISNTDIARLQQRKTPSSEAYRLYLNARFNFAGGRAGGMERAIGLYRQAVEIDPQFAPAYAGIGECYMVLGDSSFGLIKPGEAYDNATAAIKTALELDPDLAEALAILGNIQAKHLWDIPASETSYRRAIELNPNYARAHTLLAWTLIRESRFDEADTEFQRAAELDPTSLEIAAESGYPAFFAGDYDRAIRIFRDAVSRDKDFWGSHMVLWRGLHHAGLNSESAAEIDAAERLTGPGVAVVEMVRAQTNAAIGKISEARGILNDLIARRRKGNVYVSPLFIAVVAAELNDTDLAFKYLYESVEERNDYMPFMKFAPEFNGLHSDPRFADLIRRIGIWEPKL